MAWDNKHTRMRQLPPNWRNIRRQVIDRDRVCVLCGNPGTDVDHIERGQDHSLRNLRLLCRACHMARTGRDGGKAPREPRGPSAIQRAREARKEDHPGIIRDK